MGGADGRLIHLNNEKRGYCASCSSIKLMFHNSNSANDCHAKEINYPIFASCSSSIPTSVGGGILDCGIFAKTRM